MMMKRLLITAFGLLLAALPAAAQPSASFVPSECAFPVPGSADVTCGTLSVPENRANAASRQIQLAVAVFESASPTGDPIVFLQGGPGGSTLSLASQLYPTFIAPLLAERDVILVDQRGTGASVPALNCPEVSAASTQDLVTDLPQDEQESLYLESFTACRDRLTSEGVDLSAYTSRENAADIADLITALGYEQAHLYGGSYGTRLALTVLRDHPQVVASLIIDSAIPVEVNLYDEQAFKTDFALNRLFSACARDTACAAAYPELAADFYGVVAALASAPVTVATNHPLTGAPVEAVIGDSEFISAVFLAMQVPQLIPSIPQIITQVRDGDTSGLALPVAVSLALSDAISFGMFVSTNCAEEIYASTPEQMQAAWDEYPLVSNFAAGAAFGSAQNAFAVCDAWGAQAFQEGENTPVTGDVPVLALAGEFDPATPAVWTQQVAAAFPGSYYYEFGGSTHVVATSSACAVDLIRQFVANPAAAPDAECVASAAPIAFALPASSAAPAAQPLELTLYEDADGWSTQVPAGWTELQPGVFARAATLTDPTVLLAGLAPSTAEEALLGVLGAVGIDEMPQAVGTRQTNAGEWTLYRVNAMGFEIALAALNASGGVVVLQTMPADYDSLYEQVFLPALDAFSAG
jgi:pimeloyl-ACP methyl ester carboxylesterase